MEGKLIKENDFYMLEVRHERIGDMIIASSDHDFSKIINHRFKLSTKNCQSIENGYDLDDKISKHLEKNDIEASAKRVQVIRELILEILGDKKFTKEDMGRIMVYGYDKSTENEYLSRIPFDEYIQSLQQTEWDVEICCQNDCYGDYTTCKKSSFECQICTNTGIPKLDEDGCLILRRK